VRVFIELTEFLRCPEDHAEAHCVLAPGEISARRVMTGVVGCPVCQREYRISGGVTRFGTPKTRPNPVPPPAAIVLQAALNLMTPGGYVVLVGSAVSVAECLAPALSGIHLVGVNAPDAILPGPDLTLLDTRATLPLRSSMARGVVLGAEATTGGWPAEATRVLLNGLRLVALAGELHEPGIEPIASGAGMWVGRKTGERGRGMRDE
jgi:hypothetical protein